MTKEEIIKVIEKTIYDEEEIDFTGIMAGDYSINETKNILANILIEAIEQL